MTNIHDCIERAVKANQLPQGHGQAAQNAFQQLVARYSDIYPIHQAQAMASKDLKEATKKAARARFHSVVNQLQAMRRIRGIVEKSDNPARTIRNFLEHSPDSTAPNESVRFLAEAYQDRIRQIMYDTLNETGLNMAGNSRNPVLLADMIRELHGDATGNGRAADLAKAVRQAQNEMRLAFNAHGGDIGELSDYGVAHSHSSDDVLAAGFDTWATKIEGKLAWDRIIDNDTGLPFAAAGQIPARAVSEPFLRSSFKNITTAGWVGREPAMVSHGRALYNQGAEHRVLHFKTGQDWLDYNAEFGRADPFSTMMQGLYGLADDVAMMRVLGPNPAAGLEYARQVGVKLAKTRGNTELANRIERQAKLAKTMLNHQSGAASVPDHIGMARFFSGTRSYLVSAQLGSAVASSVTDEATMRAAASVVGMNPGNVLSREVKLIASSATREQAARMGFTAQALADAAAGTSRYFGKMFSGGIPDRLANFTLRASGLTFLTDMRRLAFQMEMAGHLADSRHLAFADLDPHLKALMEPRGIKARDWDAFRAVVYEPEPGTTFLSPLYWLEHQTTLPRSEAEGLALRLQSIFKERMELAIPSASLEGRARLLGDTKPGSIAGEAVRSVATYKSFALSLMLNQVRQWQSLPAGMSKATYAANISVSLLLLGALAIQAKEISKGNDPRPMTEQKFWAAALLQGGGLGIFGDFFAAETSRVGGGLAETFAGPVVGLAGALVSPVASNLARVTDGKESLAGRDVANLARYYTPVASSLWYGRVAYDRIVADQLQQFLDGDASAVWTRQMQRREREYGNRTWWSRGATTPSRAPDLLNAIGANQ